ncbi:hypothetical protein KAR28_04295 [Candidatus Parcubacteria bacterium]|nr:hypothetical protein [Candidatus Parcubacteria bacterium]
MTKKMAPKRAKKTIGRKQLVKKKTAISKPAKRSDEWIGGVKLLEKSTNKEVLKNRDTIMVTAHVLNVTPLGIVVLGGQPYLNKLGRKDKLVQYGKGKWSVEYDWVQIAKDDKEKAICKARIVNGNKKPLCDWAIGEASPASLKMGTLAGYQNHLAQTRAHNRAIEEFIGIRIHNEMIANISKLKQVKGSPSVPLIDTSVSAEEMGGGNNGQPAQQEVTVQAEEEFECHECGNIINKASRDYSKKLFGKPLCRGCQELKKKEVIREKVL